MKDGTLAMMIKAYVNDKFSDYGEVSDCMIDTASNSLTVHAMMKGETQAVTVTVERYEIETEGADTYIVLKSFTSSRTWLTLLLSKLFTDKRYKLPSAAAAFL